MTVSREAYWTIDRSQYTLFVYGNSNRMRRDLLHLKPIEGSELELLENARCEPLETCSYLSEALDRHRGCFTTVGNNLLTDLQERV